MRTRGDRATIARLPIGRCGSMVDAKTVNKVVPTATFNALRLLCAGEGEGSSSFTEPPLLEVVLDKTNLHRSFPPTENLP